MAVSTHSNHFEKPSFDFNQSINDQLFSDFFWINLLTLTEIFKYLAYEKTHLIVLLK